MKKETFAYLLNDQDWPPLLYRVLDSDPFTGLVSVAPAARKPENGVLSRVLWVDPEDVWTIAEA